MWKANNFSNPVYNNEQLTRLHDVSNYLTEEAGSGEYKAANDNDIISECFILAFIIFV